MAQSSWTFFALTLAALVLLSGCERPLEDLVRVQRQTRPAVSPARALPAPAPIPPKQTRPAPLPAPVPPKQTRPAPVPAPIPPKQTRPVPVPAPSPPKQVRPVPLPAPIPPKQTRPAPVPAPPRHSRPTRQIRPAPVPGRPVRPVPLPAPVPGRPVRPVPLPAPVPGRQVRPVPYQGRRIRSSPPFVANTRDAPVTQQPQGAKGAAMKGGVAKGGLVKGGFVPIANTSIVITPPFIMSCPDGQMDDGNGNCREAFS